MRRWTILEAFFRNDQEIREWVDLFIEKLFTVNLLSGSDADAEFYQGQQAVEKIASSFQEMFDLPNEVLVDGIRQLVEQRLPDNRVIDNFPDFYQLMNDMISVGIKNMQVSDTVNFPQQIANLKDLQLNAGAMSIPSSKITLGGGGANAKELDSAFSLRHHLLKAMDSAQVKESTRSIDSTQAIGSSETLYNFDSNTRLAEDNKEVVSEVANEVIGDIISELKEDNVLVPQESSSQGKDLSYPADPISKSLHELIDESMKQLLQESHSSIDEYTAALIQSPISNTVLAENPMDSTQTSSLDSAEEISEDSVPALSVTSHKITAEDQTNMHSFPPRRDPFRLNTQKKKKSHALVDLAVKPLATVQEIPQEGKALSQVLKNLCGNSLVEWQVSIDEHLFLARVNTLLIHVYSEGYNPLDEGYMKEIHTKMKKHGFKVFACSKEDLSYPRRLEREIRRLMR